MEVEIRELTSEDFDNEKLIQGLLDMEVVGYKTSQSLKEIFEKRKVNTDTHIAIVDGTIVGIMSLMIHYSFTGRNLGVPMDVYVSPKYRKQGIAKRFIDILILVDRSKVWRIFGPVAKDLVSLYEKGGFSRKDVVYMERKITF